MRLKRISTSHPHEEESAEYKAFGTSATYVDFEKFGSGTDNFSWLRTSFEWADVESLIEAFAQMGHQEAKKLQLARNLGAAVEEFAKISN
jgi:hypothetical protein